MTATALGVGKLVEAMSSQRGAILVLADSQHGRLFRWTDGGRLVEHLRVDAEADQGRHLVDIAHRAASFHREAPDAHILVAGPEEDLAVLTLELTSSVPEAAIITIDIPVDAPVDEISRRLGAFVRRHEDDFERQLIDDLMHAHEVGTAVVGLSATARAVSAGGAMLVVIEVSAAKRGEAEALLRRALETGCRVQVVRGDAALHLVGGIGAHLRRAP